MTKEEFDVIERCYRDLIYMQPADLDLSNFKPYQRYLEAKKLRYETMLTEKAFVWFFE